MRKRQFQSDGADGGGAEGLRETNGADTPRDSRRDSEADDAQGSSRESARDDAPGLARDARVAAERRLLAALCQSSIAAELRGEALRRLRQHAFSDPENEIIFRALAKIPEGDAEFTRTALGLRLTRAGFPDFDLDPLFAAPPPDAEALAEILRDFDAL